MAQPMRKDGEAKVAPDGGPAACGFGNRAVRLALGLWSAVVFAVFLTACSINLAPAHDPSLVQGLSDANNDAMILFADVSTGVDEATFGERRETYNSIIGRIDALRLQASARPLPSPAVSRTLRERLGDENAEMILTPPTESSLAEVAETLTRMRDTDRARGLTPTLVQGFRNNYEISMDQALTYEKALQR